MSEAYIRARGLSLPQLATAFSRLTNTGSSLNRLVVDRSGLPGLFDVDLQFTPDHMPPADALPPGLPAADPNAPPVSVALQGQGVAIPVWLPRIDPNGPSIFTAVQEQLGLKLDPQRAPVDVLVIDRVHAPTED